MLKLNAECTVALFAIRQRALGDRVPEAARPHVETLLERGAVRSISWGQPGNVEITIAGLDYLERMCK